ncbi:phosphotransferase [Longispora urticae]
MSTWYAEGVDERTATAICDALAGFATWDALPEVCRPWWDYPTRVEQARADGLLSAAGHRATTRLLDVVGDRRVLQHGDALPANLLHDPDTGRVALVDLEFVGTYIEGLDLALVDLLIGSRSPALRASVTARAAYDGLEVGYALNLLLLVAREIALHRRLPDPAVRAARQNLLAGELDRAQALVADTARRHP